MFSFDHIFCEIDEAQGKGNFHFTVPYVVQIGIRRVVFIANGNLPVYTKDNLVVHRNDITLARRTKTRRRGWPR